MTPTPYERQFENLPGWQSVAAAFERIDEPDQPYGIGQSREGLGICEPGLITGIFGVRGLGKTMLALWVVAEVLRNNGTVAYLNLDNNRPHKLMQRLHRALGVDVNLIRAGLLLLSPDDGNSAHLAMAKVRDNPPTLIVVDTLDVLARKAAKNPNDNAEMVDLLGVIRGWLADTHSAALYLDHVSVKNDSAGGAKGAMGATHKGSHTDIYLSLTEGKKFSRTVRGHLELTIVKDREGGIEGFVKAEAGKPIGQWYFGGDAAPELTIPSEGLPTSDTQDSLAAEMLKHPKFFELGNNDERKKLLRSKGVKFASSDFAAAKNKATDEWFNTIRSLHGSIQEPLETN